MHVSSTSLFCVTLKASPVKTKLAAKINNAIAETDEERKKKQENHFAEHSGSYKFMINQ